MQAELQAVRALEQGITSKQENRRGGSGSDHCATAEQAELNN